MTNYYQATNRYNDSVIFDLDAERLFLESENVRAPMAVKPDIAETIALYKRLRDYHLQCETETFVFDDEQVTRRLET